MPVPEPTALELREARTWRVVTLCCDSREPDWHAAGQPVRAGGDVLVRVQGAFDGRCGWEGAQEPRLFLDGADMAVRPLLVDSPQDLERRRGATWLGPPPNADYQAAAPVLLDEGGYGLEPLRRGPLGDHAWVGAIPTATTTGSHAFMVRFRDCSWSGSIQVGAPVGAAPPPVPVTTAEGRWVEIPGYGIAMWFCGDAFDATAESRMQVPQYRCAETPTVICALDATGHSLGAWGLRYWEVGAPPIAADGYLGSRRYRVDPYEVEGGPCDALR